MTISRLELAVTGRRLGGGYLAQSNEFDSFGSEHRQVSSPSPTLSLLSIMQFNLLKTYSK